MGVVSESLGNSVSPHSIEYKGKMLPVKLIDQGVKAAWEKERFERAKKAVAAVRDIVSPEDYAGRVDNLVDAYELGEYDLMSVKGLAHFKTVPGARLMLSLLMGCSQEEVAEIVTAKKDEVKDLLHLIVRESFPGTRAQETNGAPPDPNP